MGKPIELMLSKEVSALTEESVEFAPAQGKAVKISKFVAEGAFSENAVVKLIWDFEGAGETPIWTIKGSSEMPFIHTIPKKDVNGTKKLAVVLENSLLGPVFLSGYVEFEEL